MYLYSISSILLRLKGTQIQQLGSSRMWGKKTNSALRVKTHSNANRKPLDGLDYISPWHHDANNKQIPIDDEQHFSEQLNLNNSYTKAFKSKGLSNVQANRKVSQTMSRNSEIKKEIKKPSLLEYQQMIEGEIRQHTEPVSISLASSHQNKLQRFVSSKRGKNLGFGAIQYIRNDKKDSRRPKTDKFGTVLSPEISYRHSENEKTVLSPKITTKRKNCKNYNKITEQKEQEKFGEVFVKKKKNLNEATVIDINKTTSCFYPYQLNGQKSIAKLRNRQQQRYNKNSEIVGLSWSKRLQLLKNRNPEFDRKAEQANPLIKQLKKESHASRWMTEQSNHFLHY